MPKISESFSGKWLNAADLDDDEFVATITEVTEEEIGQGKDKDVKLVVWMRETEKGLVLNKTNGKVLASILGDETDDWAKKKIVLLKMEVEFGGKTVDGIRVDKNATKKANTRKEPDAGEQMASMIKNSKKPAKMMTQAEADSDDDPAY